MLRFQVRPNNHRVLITDEKVECCRCYKDLTTNQGYFLGSPDYIGKNVICRECLLSNQDRGFRRFQSGKTEFQAWQIDEMEIKGD